MIRRCSTDLDEDSDDSEAERDKFVTAVTEVAQRLLREDASNRKTGVSTEDFEALQVGNRDHH